MELTKEYNFIWYGQCGTDDLADCDEYTLPDDGGKIEQVWQINDAGDAKVWDRTAPSGADFNKLICGHAYYIRLGKNGDTVQTIDIDHAVVSDFADNSHVHPEALLLGTCEEGGQGPQPQQASIAHGACSSETIHLTANVNDVIANYETCDLQATGATFQAIGLTTSNNVTYKLEGSTLSYKIADTANANVGGEEEVTITAIADALYEFGDASNTLVVKLQATVNALPPAIQNFANGQVVRNNQLLNNNAVQFNAVPLVANAPAGAKLKFNVVGPDDVKVVDNVVKPIDQVAPFGDQFLHAGEYTVTAEIVNASEISLEPQVITDEFTFTIDRSIASISVEDIDHGTLDRDNLPNDVIKSVTTPNTDGDWSITDEASNGDITVIKVGDSLKSTLDTDTLGTVDADNEVTLSANGTKWHRVLGADGGLTPPTLEVTTTCTITAVVEDDVVFTCTDDAYVDNRDTDAQISTSGDYTLTQDNVDVSATLSGDVGWQINVGGQGWENNADDLSINTDGTTTFKIRYNSQAVTTGTMTATLVLTATGQDTGTSAGSVTINLSATITQAIGEATFSGCTSLDAITFEVGATSHSGSNNKECTLTTTNCSVPDAANGVKGIFSYTIIGGLFNYWITDPNTVQTSTETLEVTATADNHFEFADNETSETISITLSGTVNAAVVPASIAGCDNLTKIILDEGATSSKAEGSETCTLTLNNAVVSDGQLNGTNQTVGGKFNFELDVASSDTASTTYTLTYWLDSTATAEEDISDAATIQAELSAGGTEWAEGDGTYTIVFNADVNEVVVAEDLLWIGFQDGGNSTYTNWYELDTIETEEVSNLDINSTANAVNGWNSFYTGTDRVIVDGSRYSPALHDDDGWNPFATGSGMNDSLLSSYFSTYEELKNALSVGHISGDGSGAEFNIVPSGRSTAIVISFIAPLPYTSFQIASGDSAYSTELSSLMASGGSDVGYLQGVMITASPDRPSGALDATQQGKTYNSDLLNVFCNGCPPESGGEGVLLKIVQVVGAGTDTKSYNATSCSHGGMTTGNWQNSNLYYAGSASASQGSVARQDPESSPIVINEMYFELASAATKLKLTDGKLPDCD